MAELSGVEYDLSSKISDSKIKSNHTFRKVVLIMLIFLFPFIVVPAEAGKLVSWKEEVLLHDGSKIVVKRWQKHDEPPSYVGELPAEMKDPKYLEIMRSITPYHEKISNFRTHGIRFEHPKTKTTIVWEDGPTKDISWPSFRLLALHIKDGIPYLITEPSRCSVYNKWGRPNSAYIIFKYEDGVWWKVIPISELSPEFKTMNLIIATSGDEEEILDNLCLVSSEKVAELNARVQRNDEIYKRIVRTPYEVCQEMINCGADTGWRDLNAFKKQPTYEACLRQCDLLCEKKYCPCEKLFNNKNRKGE